VAIYKPPIAVNLNLTFSVPCCGHEGKGARPSPRNLQGRAHHRDDPTPAGSAGRAPAPPTAASCRCGRRGSRRDAGGHGDRRHPGADRHEGPARGPRGDQLWTPAEQSASTRAQAASPLPPPRSTGEPVLPDPGPEPEEESSLPPEDGGAEDGDGGSVSAGPWTSEQFELLDDSEPDSWTASPAGERPRSCWARRSCGDRPHRGQGRHRHRAHRRREDRGAAGRRPLHRRRRRREGHR
jgi:hypothetical protein